MIRVVCAFIGSVLSAGLRLVTGLAGRGLAFAEAWLIDGKRARYGLAVTRMLLAVTGIGLLLANYGSRLYVFGRGAAWNGEAQQPISEFPRIWLFSLFHRITLNDAALTASYLALLVLAVLVGVGWRTKIVLPLFFVGWVSFIELNDSLGDQGDNMYRIVLLSLLFADSSARWSLDARRRARPVVAGRPWLVRKWRGEALLPAWVTNIAHNLVLVSVTCQVCFVYASGALYKAGGQPWQNGYAIYNPLHTARFGPWPELSDLVGAWGPMVTAASWGSIILQMSFPMMLLNRVTRVIALFGMLGFHIGIAVMMGLPWFSLVMIAIDCIFIRDVTWLRLTHFLGDSWAAARMRPPAPVAESVPGPARAEHEPVPATVPDAAPEPEPTREPLPVLSKAGR